MFSFFSSGYLDVSVHRVPSVYLWIQYTVHEVCSCGFPHSEICGSSDICSLPQLIAAYHVFHRLSVPRHPPCALCILTIQVISVKLTTQVLTVMPHSVVEQTKHGWNQSDSFFEKQLLFDLHFWIHIYQ